MATRAKKSAGKKSAGKKSAAKKPAARKGSAGGRLAMSIVPEPPKPPKPPKPKSNFCEIHGRLLRANRTCPISTCEFHTQPMP